MALGVQFLFISSLIFFFINEFGEGVLNNKFSTMPNEIIEKNEIWRLLFSPFFSGTLNRLLFSFLWIFNLLDEREQSQGTLLFFIELLVKSAIINIFICLFYIIETHVYLIAYLQPQNGMWNLFFYYCAVKCQQRPYSHTRILISEIQIMNRYIPIVMILIFVIFDNAIGPIISTILGFMDGMITQGSPCRFNWVNNCENSICKCFQQNASIIKHTQASLPNDQIEILRLDLNALVSKSRKTISQINNQPEQPQIAIGQNQQIQLPNIEQMLAYSQQQQQQEVQQQHPEELL